MTPKIHVPDRSLAERELPSQAEVRERRKAKRKARGLTPGRRKGDVRGPDGLLPSERELVRAAEEADGQEIDYDLLSRHAGVSQRTAERRVPPLIEQGYIKVKRSYRTWLEWQPQADGTEIGVRRRLPFVYRFIGMAARVVGPLFRHQRTSWLRHNKSAGEREASRLADPQRSPRAPPRGESESQSWANRVPKVGLVPVAIRRAFFPAGRLDRDAWGQIHRAAIHVARIEGLADAKDDPFLARMVERRAAVLLRQYPESGPMALPKHWKRIPLWA